MFLNNNNCSPGEAHVNAMRGRRQGGCPFYPRLRRKRTDPIIQDETKRCSRHFRHHTNRSEQIHATSKRRSPQNRRLRGNSLHDATNNQSNRRQKTISTRPRFQVLQSLQRRPKTWNHVPALQTNRPHNRNWPLQYLQARKLKLCRNPIDNPQNQFSAMVCVRLVPFRSEHQKGSEKSQHKNDNVSRD